MIKIARIVAALTVALALGCAAPPAERALRYRMPEDPPTLDPFRPADNNSNVYLYLVFDGLVEFQPGSTEVRPAVAESWTISPDGLTYTFKLREGVRFHNGREVRSDDVVYSIRRALSPKSGSAKGDYFEALRGKDAFWSGRSEELTGVAAPDSRTVVMTLEHPYGPFLTVLASEAGSIVPREVYDDPAKGYLRHPVGCGPYRFEAWTQGVSITLSRFPDHWKARPPGGVGRIVVRFLKSSTTAMEEYRAGNLDFTQELPPGQRGLVMKQLPDHFHNSPLLSIMYVGFNHAAGPFRDSILLRRAVSHAIDRQYIVRVLQQGKDTLATSLLPPGMLGHDPGRAGLVYDPDLAARLLAEAGYPGGRGLPELIYRSNSTLAFERIAEKISTDLAAIGLKVRPDMSDFPAFLEAMSTGSPEPPKAAIFRMTYFADWPDTDNFVATQFGTGALYNLGRLSNPDLDGLLDVARRETDTARREELYRQADTTLMQGAHLVPIYWYGEDLLANPKIGNLKLSPLGSFGIPWEEVTLSE